MKDFLVLVAAICGKSGCLRIDMTAARELLGGYCATNVKQKTASDAL